jgi:hypothetical protein
MHFTVYDVFYSLSSHQKVSSALTDTFEVMLKLQEYKGTNLVSCFAVNP